MSECQHANDKTVKVPVLNERKFGLFQSKFKSIAAIKGLAKALKPDFVSKLLAKESDMLTDSDEEKEKEKKNYTFRGSALLGTVFRTRRISILSKMQERSNGLQGLRTQFGRTPKTNPALAMYWRKQN